MIIIDIPGNILYNLYVGLYIFDWHPGKIPQMENEIAIRQQESPRNAGSSTGDSFPTKTGLPDAESDGRNLQLNHEDSLRKCLLNGEHYKPGILTPPNKITGRHVESSAGLPEADLEIYRHAKFESRGIEMKAVIECLDLRNAVVVIIIIFKIE